MLLSHVFFSFCVSSLNLMPARSLSLFSPHRYGRKSAPILSCGAVYLKKLCCPLIAWTRHMGIHHNKRRKKNTKNTKPCGEIPFQMLSLSLGEINSRNLSQITPLPIMSWESDGNKTFSNPCVCPLQKIITHCLICPLCERHFNSIWRSSRVTSHTYWERGRIRSIKCKHRPFLWYVIN